MKTHIIQKIETELFRRSPGWCSTTHLGRYSGSFSTSTQISKIRRRLRPYFTIESKKSDNPEKKWFYRVM